MKIHNLMEDLVYKIVNEICDEKADSTDTDICTTPSCRLDVACFVLNRISPKYVTSSRGLAHMEDLFSDPQLTIDITALANEGLLRVNDKKRTYYNQEPVEEKNPVKGPFFNFPTIIGRLFYGDTFEPVKDMEISLFLNGDLVKMMDRRWQNPYQINIGTPGTFLFWPRYEKTTRQDKRKSVEFQLTTRETNYEGLNHFFIVNLEPDASYQESVHLQKTHVVEDLYLFPKI